MEVAAQRVLLVLGTSTGGVARHVRAVAAGLLARGHRVAIAGPSSVEDAFALSGTGARFLPVEVADSLRLVAGVRAVTGLRRLCAHAHVVHAHGLRAGALAALAVRTLPGRRPLLVVTLHNAPVGGVRVHAVHAVLECVTAGGADVVLGVSADLRRRMRRRGARQVDPAVVPAPPGRASTRSREQVRRELGVRPQQPLLVTAARLAPQKGLGMLLDVVAALARAPFGQDVLAVVAGEGPARAALQVRIDAEGLPVRLLGLRDDVPELFTAADVVVQTSVWEGQPLTVQEALRAGAALVATDVGGTAEVTGTAAELVAYGDVRAMAAAVAGLLEDSSRHRALSGAALERAELLPRAGDAVDAVEDLYTRLARRRAGGEC